MFADRGTLFGQHRYSARHHEYAVVSLLQAETRQEVADRLEAEESERQMNELGNRLSTMLSKRSTRGADLESTKSVSSEGSNRLSIMLSRLHSRSSRDTENDGGETVEPVRHGRAESPDSGAPLESEVNRKDGV